MSLGKSVLKICSKFTGVPKCGFKKVASSYKDQLTTQAVLKSYALELNTQLKRRGDSCKFVSGTS